MIKLWDENMPHYESGLMSADSGIVPFVPSGGAARGAVIIAPGGAYASKAEHEGAPVALWLNKNNIAAFVLDYRVAPNRHPAPLIDMLRAVRLVRYNAKKWNINPGKIAVLGFSAGGHLAMSAALKFNMPSGNGGDPVEKISARPDAALLCYPVVTMGEGAHNGSRENLLGKNPSADLIKALSGEKNVGENTPPMFIWHTADDEAVPVSNSINLAGALDKAKIPFELHIFPKGRHGLGLAREDISVGQWRALALGWFRGMGF